MADMAAYGVAFIPTGILSPYFAVNLAISKDTSSVCHKQAEDIVFFRGKADFSAVTVYFPPIQVNFQSRKRNHRLIPQPQIPDI